MTVVTSVHLLFHLYSKVTGTLIRVVVRINWEIHESRCSAWHAEELNQFSRSVESDSLQPHGLQHTKPPWPSPTPGAHSNSCPSSQWCHPAISSSVVPLASCLQSFPASGSFPMSQFFTSGSQSIEVSASASILPMNIQDWFLWGELKEC